MRFAAGFELTGIKAAGFERRGTGVDFDIGESFVFDCFERPKPNIAMPDHSTYVRLSKESEGNGKVERVGLLSGGGTALLGASHALLGRVGGMREKE